MCNETMAAAKTRHDESKFKKQIVVPQIKTLFT